MIELLSDLPSNVIGIHAEGRITADDYENVIIPAVEARLKEHEKVRVLYSCGKDVDGVEMKAMWDDAKVGFKNMSAWERIAVVTDVGWMRSSVKMFGFMMPCPVKVFGEAEMDQARAWIVE